MAPAASRGTTSRAASGHFAYLLNGDVGRALGLFGDLPGRSATCPAGRRCARCPDRRVCLPWRGRLWAGDLESAAGDLALAVNRISAGIPDQRRDIGPIPRRALAFLAETEFRLGRWDDARARAGLAIALARDDLKHGRCLSRLRRVPPMVS